MAENFPHETVALLKQQKLDVADPVIIAKTGWTTDELQMAIREEGVKETFSFVTLLIGVNNQYRGREADNYRQEFTALLTGAINFANGHAPHVFVLSIPDWGVTPFAADRDREQVSKEIDSYNAACKDITLADTCQYLRLPTVPAKTEQHLNTWLKTGCIHRVRSMGCGLSRLVPMIVKTLKG